MDPLFGSETRAKVLEELALTPIPQTAYRLSQLVDAEPIQVLKVLKALEGHAKRLPEGWILTDVPLRTFLQARAARRAQEIRAEKDEILVSLGLRPSTSNAVSGV